MVVVTDNGQLRLTICSSDTSPTTTAAIREFQQAVESGQTVRLEAKEGEVILVLDRGKTK